MYTKSGLKDSNLSVKIELDLKFEIVKKEMMSKIFNFDELSKKSNSTSKFFLKIQFHSKY